MFGAIIALLASPLAVAGAELPPLPKLNMADFQPAIRKQVQQADIFARTHPRSADASGKLGMVLDAYQQYEAASLCYERARRIDPRSFAWAYYLGSIQLHQGKYDQAATTLREALQLRPGYLPAQFKLAESLLAAADFDGSEKVYEAILKSEPDSAEALYGMGRIQAARGDAASSTEFFRRACDLFPSYGAAQYALAMAYQKLGKPDEAEPHFHAYEANITVAPPIRDDLMGAVQTLDLGAEIHLRRSMELEQQGRLAEAIEEQELALLADPKNVQAHINLISLYARVGQPDKAGQHFQEATHLNPGRADAYYDHGVLLYMQGKYQEAEQSYRQALKINPYYAEAHNNLGVLLEKQGQTDAAMEEYRAAIKNQPDYRLARYHLATSLARQGNYSEAVGYLLKTLQPEDASTPGYMYALAIAYQRKGDHASALKYARQARDLATARHQTDLVSRIDRDFHGFGQDGPTP